MKDRYGNGNGHTDHHFIPLNAGQRKAVRLFQDKDILFILGPPGSGKTAVAVAVAAQRVASGQARRVVLCRPVFPLPGEEIGFTKGGIDQKMRPWVLPVHDVLSGQTHQKPDEWMKDHCEVLPLAYVRGRTFTKSVAILDEAQNARYGAITAFLTRIGRDSKLIVTGDVGQRDNPDGGLQEVLRRLCRGGLPKGVGVVKLTDTSPRHPIIGELLKRL